MAKIIGLPKLSPTMDEGTLVKWTKNEGDEVEIDELLAEVETDKATMEFRSFDRGVLLKRLVPEGTTLAPDTPVAIIGKKGEDITALLESAGAAAGAPAGKDKDKDKGGTDEAEQPARGPSKELEPELAAAPPGNGATPQARGSDGGGDRAHGAQPAPASAGGRVLASPLVRRIARERDIDLTAVAGSGPGGRIIKRDIEGMQARSPTAAPSTAGAGTPSPAAARAPAPGVPPTGGAPRAEPRVVPLSSMRRTIARRLSESKREVPHFYLTIDVDADPIVRAREEINRELEKSGEKVSVNDLLIKACAVALRRVPEVNASFAGDSLHYFDRVDISVAVAIPDGLVTPVVRDADMKGTLAISREVRELAARAKDKKLKPEEMTNGTFSISNLGMYGIEDFSAVINPPEGAILAVGVIRDEPVVRDGAVVAGRRMRMTLSCDHRVIDGATGARWLQALRGLLEQPLRMLL